MEAKTGIEAKNEEMQDEHRISSSTIKFLFQTAGRFKRSVARA
jgi:hypothetical protein